MKQTKLYILLLLYLATVGTIQERLLILRGKVERLDGSAAAHKRIRLLEPNVTGITDEDGLFSIRLPKDTSRTQKWVPGKSVTLLIAIDGHSILRPWDGKIVIQARSDEIIEKVVVAPKQLVDLIHDTPRLEKMLQYAFRSEIETRGQPQGLAEMEVFRQEAQKRGISLKELLTLLDEWKSHAEQRGNLNEKALAALYGKRFSEAIMLFNEDIALIERRLSEDENLRRELPKRYLNKGLAHYKLYEHAEAQKAFRKAIDLDSTFIEAKTSLASALLFTGHITEAMAILQNSRQQLLANKDSSTNHSRVLELLGTMYDMQGQRDSALIYFLQAFAINQKLSNSGGMADNLGNIGLVYAQQGQLDSALIFFKRSLVIDEKTKRQNGIVKSLGNIGMVYGSQGQNDSALVFLKRSLVITKTINQPESLADLLGAIGVIYKNQGHLDSAMVYYRQSLEINKKLNRVEGIAIAHNNIGDLLEQREELVAAAAHFDSASTLFSRIESPYTTKALKDLLRINLKQNPSFTWQINLSDGQIVDVLNDVAWYFALRDQNLNEALAMSERSLQLSPNNPSYLDTQAEIYFHLSRFSEAQEINNTARKYAKDKALIKSLDERAEKIATKLMEQGKK